MHAQIQITFHFDQFRQMNLNYSSPRLHYFRGFWVRCVRDKTFSSSKLENRPKETEREIAALSRV